MPVGIGYSIFINGAAAATVAPGTSLQNCAHLVQAGNGAATATMDACATSAVVPHVSTGAIQKTLVTVQPQAPGGTLTWALRASGDFTGYNITPIQPKMIDLLPPQLTYVDGSFALPPGSHISCPTASQYVVTVVPNYQNGREAVIMTAQPGATIGQFVSCVYNIQTTINPGTASGFYGNSVPQGGTNTSGTYPINPDYEGNDSYIYDVQGYMINGVQDLSDIDHDGNTSEMIESSTAGFTVAQSAALEVAKKVKGDQDPAFLGSKEVDPTQVGTSTVGGTVDWQVTLGDQGNLPLTNLVAYDLLPSPANTGVTVSRYNDTGDNNQWVPTLTGPIDTGSDPVTVYYSTNPNPCRPEMDSSHGLPIYCGGSFNANGDWVTAAGVSDWSKVRAIRFDYGAGVIQPNQYFTYTFTMSVPLTQANGTTPLAGGETAWNKIAAQGSSMAGSGSTVTLTPLLPTEAPWVVDTVAVPAAPTLYSLGDRVWVDANGNGVQDTGEASLPGVTVTLLDGAGNPVTTDGLGNPIAPAQTNSSGTYSFANLPAGAYQVRFALPSGYQWTTADVGSDDSVDSDAAAASPTAATATTATVTLGGASVPDTLGNPLNLTNPTVDAGVYQPVSVGDYTWIDANRNGVQDAGEPALPGVTATLYEADGTTQVPGVPSQTTDNTGHYEFTGLPPGQYVVKFSPPPTYSVTTSQDTPGDQPGAATDSNGLSATSLVLPSGSSDQTLDAGFVSLDLTLTKTLDGAAPFYPGNQVTFTLTPHNNGPADALAGWSVSDRLPAGLTYVSAAGAGYTCAAGGASGADVTCTAAAMLGANTDGADITVTATIDADATAPLKNVAWVTPGPNEVPENNVLVIPPNNTVDTDTTPTNNDAQATLPLAGLYSLGDRVWVDANGNGVQDAGEQSLPGVTVTLLDGSGNVVTTDALGNPIEPVQTDGSGNYSFSNLAAGSYQVQFSLPSGYQWTAANRGSDDSVDSDAVAASPTSATAKSPTATLGGAPVTDTLGNPLGLTNPTIDAGVYLPVSVGDYTWIDANRNGVQDSGESALPGVTATLYEADGVTAAPGVPTQTTDNTGHYEFTGLPPGQYVVKFSPPTGYSFTASQDAPGDQPGADVDSNGPTATSLVLPSGANDQTLDAGFVSLDLSLAKALNGAGPFYPGATVTFTLTPHNSGPAGALPGWSVSDRLPAGLTYVSATGTGYTCAAGGAAGAQVTCTAAASLAAGADGPAITVTATIEAGATAPVKNVAWVTPSPNEVPETNPLVVPPDNTVDTSTTPTNNDAQAPLTVTPFYSLGDRVWVDANGNGIQDAGEDSLPGVTVTLLDGSGNPVTSDALGNPIVPAPTDSNGNYSFANLPAGDYQVQVTLPSGYQWTAPNEGDDASADSDALADSPTAATATSATVTLDGTPVEDSQLNPLGLTNPTIDAGVYLPVSVGDYTWIDVNRNGIQDAGEPPLPGVTATLYDATGKIPVEGVPAVTTDSTGHYEFTGLPPGQYVVKFSPPAGYGFTTSQDTPGDQPGAGVDSNGPTATSLVLPSGTRDQTLDAGFVSLDLSLTKALNGSGPFKPGDTVSFALTPHNSGPADALPGWSVTEVLPAGLTLVSMSGAGYACAGATCTAAAALPANADGPVITVTATIDSAATGSLHNVAYVSPGPGETPETNPLTVPMTTTDTSTSATNNDAQADVPVTAPPAPPVPPRPAASSLPFTGAAVLQWSIVGALLAGLGIALLAAGRRRRSES